MKSLTALLGEVLRQATPASVKRRIPVSVKARARAFLGVEPWPDLAIRHQLFRTAQYKRLRELARPFDTRKPHKPVLERGHQASYVVARWFAEAGVKTVFHVGYANGRYLFYLSRMGIVCGGTDLPSDETPWTAIPSGVLDDGTRGRLLQVDFFDLAPGRLAAMWENSGRSRVDVLFSEATFETMLPWRNEGVSVPKYAAMDAEALHTLMHQRFPAKVEDLREWFQNLVFIEPEPTAGGAGMVFGAVAERVPEFVYSVWAFRPPFDTLFRLSPWHPTKQTVYAYTRNPGLLEALRAYASPVPSVSACGAGPPA